MQPISGEVREHLLRSSLIAGAGGSEGVAEETTGVAGLEGRDVLG